MYISKLKEQLSLKCGIAPERLFIIYGVQLLEESDRIEKCNIEDGDYVHVITS